MYSSHFKLLTQESIRPPSACFLGEGRFYCVEVKHVDLALWGRRTMALTSTNTRLLARMQSTGLQRQKPQPATPLLRCVTALIVAL